MRKTCLIVDDDQTIRDFLKALLHRDDFETMEAETAPQALKLVQKLEGNIDLVVTDIRMPGDMDGLDLAYAVRREFPAVPVLLISGFACESSGRPLGEFELIKKPFKLEEILTAARKLTGCRKVYAPS